MATMTGAEMEIAGLGDFRDKLHLTWEDIAATIGVDQSTLVRWRNGESSPRPMARSRLVQIGELAQMLRRMFAGADHAREWLKESHPEVLAGATPLEVLRSGRIDRVLMLLHFLARGA